MTDQSGTEGAWHPDPLNRYSQRWWDGSAWTDQVIDATGETITDPMGVTAAPAVDATIVDPVAPLGTNVAYGTPPPPGAIAAGTAGVGGSSAMGGTGSFPSTPTGGYPAAAGAAPTKATNSMALAAIILAAVGVFCIPPLALGAVVCGVLGLSAAKESGVGKGMSIAGLAIGALTIVGWLIVVASLFLLGSTATNNLDDLEINSDPSNGVCDPDRWIQDPDCGSTDSGG